MPLSTRWLDDQMLPAAKGFSARRNKRYQLVQREVEMLKQRSKQKLEPQHLEAWLELP